MKMLGSWSEEEWVCSKEGDDERVRRRCESRLRPRRRVLDAGVIESATDRVFLLLNVPVQIGR